MFYIYIMINRDCGSISFEQRWNGFCETPEESRFLRKGRTVKLGQNPEFFYISDDETNFTVGIVSRNLATTLNFIKFRDSRIFTFFKALRVGQDTWRIRVAQDETHVKL